MALTFVNQVGAVEGMNQAAPGTLIPDSFVRWSQDVLFDRAGLMRRRGPFRRFKWYNSNNIEQTNYFLDADSDDEFVLGSFSTYDPNGTPIIGMLVSRFDESAGVKFSTEFRVFDNDFRLIGQEVLFEGTETIETLSVVTAKPALGGGLWISAAGTPKDSASHFQLYWRGGGGSESKSDVVFSTETIGGSAYISASAGVASGVDDIVPGMFAYVDVGVSPAIDYRYVGVVKSASGTNVTFEKRPFVWDDTINGQGSFTGTVTNKALTSDVATLTLGSHSFVEGDTIKVSGVDATFNGTYTITTVTATTISYDKTADDVGSQAATGTVISNLLILVEGNKKVKFTSVRPYEHVHGRGLLKTTTGSTNVLSGELGTSAEGHWKAANVTDYGVYRSSDHGFIGKVASVTDNKTLVLSTNALIALDGEEYIMRRVKTTDLVEDFIVKERAVNSFAGLYTTVYAGLQWYGNFANDDANTNRVVFSAYHDDEAVDLSLDAADSIIFPGKSQFRGLGASSAGLLVFLEDRTYILRGNDRTNFSVEQLVPEGCLCASSIVEYGGGVFWAGKTGIMFFDGASVRNLSKDNLGLYYTDSLDVFDPELDRVYGFVHKNNLIMHYTAWKSPFDPIRYEPIYAADWQSTDGIADRSWDEFDSDFDYDDFFTENNTPIFWDQQILNNPEESAQLGKTFQWNDALGDSNWQATTNVYKWGPLRKNTSITFAVYLPTNAITTLSNMDFRGSTSIETANGLKTIIGANVLEKVSATWRRRTAFLDYHPVFDTNTFGEDAELIEKINMPEDSLVKGPDFYIQTKHFTVGDPILRKWFQRVLLSMLLYNGAMRMDLLDDDDNDAVDINKKKPRYWETFTEKGYDWDYLTSVVFPKLVSPNRSSWTNVQATLTPWIDLFTSDFNRYAKRISWRKSSVGFRLYQMNKYKKPFETSISRPRRVEVQGFSIGFKPLRQGRI